MRNLISTKLNLLEQRKPYFYLVLTFVQQTHWNGNDHKNHCWFQLFYLVSFYLCISTKMEETNMWTVVWIQKRHITSFATTLWHTHNLWVCYFKLRLVCKKIVCQASWYENKVLIQESPALPADIRRRSIKWLCKVAWGKSDVIYKRIWFIYSMYSLFFV